ncbi:MAG: hypothetical protein H8E46_01070 [FCB group bacterium]|nr:hypothetical protein [FCB group bacterium]
MFGFKPFNIFYGGVDSVTYGGYILVDDILFSSYAPTGHGTVYVYADTTTNSVSREPGTTTATFILLLIIPILSTRRRPYRSPLTGQGRLKLIFSILRGVR